LLTAAVTPLAGHVPADLFGVVPGGRGGPPAGRKARTRDPAHVIQARPTGCHPLVGLVSLQKMHATRAVPGSAGPPALQLDEQGARACS